MKIKLNILGLQGVLVAVFASFFIFNASTAEAYIANEKARKKACWDKIWESENAKFFKLAKGHPMGLALSASCFAKNRDWLRAEMYGHIYYSLTKNGPTLFVPRGKRTPELVKKAKKLGDECIAKKLKDCY